MELPDNIRQIVKAPTKAKKITSDGVQMGTIYERTFRDYSVFKVRAQVNGQSKEIQVSKLLPLGTTLHEGMSVSFTLSKNENGRIEAVVREVLATRTAFGKLMRSVRKPNDYGKMIMLHEGKVKYHMGESGLILDKLPEGKTEDDYLEDVTRMINDLPSFRGRNLEFECTARSQNQTWWMFYDVRTEYGQNTDTVTNDAETGNNS